MSLEFGQIQCQFLETSGKTFLLQIHEELGRHQALLRLLEQFSISFLHLGLDFCDFDRVSLVFTVFNRMSQVAGQQAKLAKENIVR